MEFLDLLLGKMLQRQLVWVVYPGFAGTTATHASRPSLAWRRPCILLPAAALTPRTIVPTLLPARPARRLALPCAYAPRLVAALTPPDRTPRPHALPSWPVRGCAVAR